MRSASAIAIGIISMNIVSKKMGMLRMYVLMTIAKLIPWSAPMTARNRRTTLSAWPLSISAMPMIVAMPMTIAMLLAVSPKPRAVRSSAVLEPPLGHGGLDLAELALQARLGVLLRTGVGLQGRRHYAGEHRGEDQRQKGVQVQQRDPDDHEDDADDEDDEGPLARRGDGGSGGGRGGGRRGGAEREGHADRFKAS